METRLLQKAHVGVSWSAATWKVAGHVGEITLV